MPKPLIAVVGPSGSGKSSSLRNLNPSTTRIIDLEKKGFPFKGIKNFNYVKSIANLSELKKEIDEATKPGACDVLVIESFTTFTENVLAWSRSCNKGYDIYSQYNQSIGTFLKSIKNDNCIVVVTAIDEIVKIPMSDGSESTRNRIMVQGKEWEGKVEKEFLMVLFTETKKDKATGNIIYNFMTNTDGLNSAKTPMEMFTDRLVNNDLAMVIQKMNEYYK